MREIPIEVAKSICQAYDLEHVIIIGTDSSNDPFQSMITWGDPEKGKFSPEKSRDLGNELKRYLGWPERACYAELGLTQNWNPKKILLCNVKQQRRNYD